MTPAKPFIPHAQGIRSPERLPKSPIPEGNGIPMRNAGGNSSTSPSAIFQGSGQPAQARNTTGRMNRYRTTTAVSPATAVFTAPVAEPLYLSAARLPRPEKTRSPVRTTAMA